MQAALDLKNALGDLAPTRAQLPTKLGGVFEEPGQFFLAAIAHLQIRFVLEHTACATHSKIQMHVLTLFLLAVVITAGIIAHREWVKLGSDDPGLDDSRKELFSGHGIRLSNWLRSDE